MTRLAAASAIAIGFVFTSASAQTRPDFSGRWTVEPATTDTARAGRAAGTRSGRSGDMGTGWGQSITITQDAKQLTIEYPFFTRRDLQPPLRFVYALDGSETRNSVMMGRGIQTSTSRTTWQGQTLVITTIHTFPHPETGRATTSEVTRTLSLESPASLQIETVIHGVLGGPATTTRAVYRKS